VAAIFMCFGSGRHALGQWTSVDLHPTVATESHALGVGDGQQVGYVVINGTKTASLWSGTAATWVSLAPPGATESIAYRTREGVQVGYATIAGRRIAGMWSGTAASWTPLEPAGATDSVAYGVEGGHQVGYAVVNGVQLASLWSGTPQSWLSLHPAGSTFSIAYATEGNLQGGVSQWNECSWSGTAASWSQFAAAGGGRAFAIDQGRFFGYRRSGRYNNPAAAGWNPSAYLAGGEPDLDSMIFDSFGGYQIGYDIDFGPTAVLHHASSGLFEWLYSGPSWDPTVERPMGIWVGQNALFIVGDGGTLSAHHAWLYKRPLCRPDADYSGTLTVNDIFVFINAWFAGNSAGNFSNDLNTNVQDIFDFLNAWLAGC
jgi:hypothetical protein